MYTYSTLESLCDSQLAQCLSRAFGDYCVSVPADGAVLLSHLEESGVDRAASYGAFREGRLIGLLLNAQGEYGGERAVFAVAAGVVPEHRGRQVFHHLLARAEGELARQGAQAYYLEVLRQNRDAIRLYQGLGFSVAREYQILRSAPAAGGPVPPPAEETDLSRFDPGAAGHCLLAEPSFEHTTAVLLRRARPPRVRYMTRQGRISAFCVFDQASGAVFQLGYAHLPDLGALVQGLVSSFPAVTVKNLDVGYPQLLRLLSGCSFQVVAGQYELRKPLSGG
ncbi:GNAT family N-acetyltransferase [Flavonifractor hominis]|uniref:GNAT family N-acetyltransferase n=1 Tax=Flavonifractor hominis TaxID=3133178 RepID=A0ABV1ETI1_9FIRM